MKVFRKKAILLLGVAMVLAVGPAAGQGIYLDHADGLTPDGHIPDGAILTFYMRIVGDETNHTMLNNGYVFYSDGINWNGITVAWNPAYPWDEWFDFVKIANLWSTGSQADTIGIGLLALFGPGLPAGFDDWAYSFTIGPVTGPVGETLTLDSSWYPPANPWMWDVVGVNVAWGGPYSFNNTQPMCEPPYFTSEPVTLATVGQEYTYAVETGGYPAPTFSLVDAPPGMSIDPVTGVIEWVPTEPGEYTVCVEAVVDCWSGPLTNVQCFVITVLPAYPYTYCTPQPTILKDIESILYVHIVNENPSSVDFESIRVQEKIPPYAGVTVENGEIITTAFVMRFLGSSGFRPITADFEAIYTVDYNYLDGTPAPQLVGDFSLQVYPGDVTFDGQCDLNDVIFMADYFWGGGNVCYFDSYEVSEFMDINGDGEINPLDMRKIIELAGI